MQWPANGCTRFLMPQNQLSVALGATALVAAAALYYTGSSKKNDAPFPPGPKGTFLLGNATDMPPSEAWLTFSEWAKTYGPIVHLNIFGRHIIVLNDLQYAADMLEKKSRIYSNRPNLVMGGNLVGWDQGPALIQFGKTWSQYRRLIAQFLGTRLRVETSYNHVLEESTHSLLNSLLQTPNSWKKHGYRFAGAIVLKVTFGYEVGDETDPLVKLGDKAMIQFSEMTNATAFAVDTFPSLLYVPKWFPGAGWQKKIVPYRTTLQNMLDIPFEWAKKQMEMGTSKSCVVSDLLESQEEEESIIRWVAGGIFSGGAETTATAFQWFILAMLLYPEAQRKAQAELDAVLGPCTVPRLADHSRLPYIEALMCEVLRKYPMIPLGLAHAAAEDDIHEGFFIPKGAVVIPNNWHFCHDPSIYPNPDSFEPERFIETPTHAKEKDPRDIIFGYGRRVCPGIHLADASMWLLFASILAFFDISAPMQDGHPVLPSGKHSNSGISHPEPFECTISVRKGGEEAIRRFADV
ncbi:cytochrome P450 [Roridomyces roridus]|uniref:Cytochrome P450 n=1 Tax=Roridomyces roridus TaxID=1738132 RepID=A0AAD7C5C7_9AGAR|nr:cytochrome P450 [Roridomyces roridus]